MPSIFKKLTTLAGVLICLSPALAVTNNWTNSLGGDFSSPGNWSLGVVPGVYTSAMFNTTSALPYTVAMSADVTNDSMIVRKDRLILDLAGYNYTLNVTNASAHAGEIGFNAGDVSYLTITNSAATTNVVDFRHQLHVGLSGTGSVTAIGSNVLMTTHTATNTTPADQRLAVDLNGTVQVLAGAQFNSMTNTSNISSGGQVIVSGPGSVWRNNGCNLPGTVIISNGAQVVSPNSGIVSLYSGGRMILDAVAVQSGARFHLGNGNNNATLEIRGGSMVTVTSYAVKIGNVAGVDGVATVILTNAGSLVYTPVTVNGGCCVGGDTLNSLGTGVLSLAEGAIVSARVVVWSNGTLQGNGLIDCRGVNVTNSGVIHPLGTLTITNGSYVQNASGALNIGLGGTVTGQYGRLVVFTNASWAGTLNVALNNGFQPAHNDRFDIMDWSGAAIGTFDTVNLPALSGGKGWITTNLYLTGELRVSPPSGSVFSMY